MKRLLITGILISSLYTLSAQTANSEAPLIRYIEVTGSAEMEIVPDEIYINVTLQERYDGRTKVTMAQQEEKFINGMKALSIPLSDISLSDALSDYSSYKWRKEDALATKEYMVLVHTAEMVSKVYDKLIEADAENAYILKTSHSKIEAYRKEVKINAIKATYDKAGYMLSAIGQQIGKPLVITELDAYVQPMDAYSQLDLNSYRGSNLIGARETDLATIGFKKIKLRYEVYGKFEIQ